MVSIFQFENIHIQVSYLPEEAECKEEDFKILILYASNSNLAISILLILFPKFDPMARYA